MTAGISAADLPRVASKIRGRITLPADGSHPTPRIVIVQGATADTANAIDEDGAWIMIYDYKPSSVAPTTAQLRRREKFSEAVQHYRSMTTIQKESYRIIADEERISIFNAVIKDYMTAGPDITVAEWDAGTSIWDSGASVWDSDYSTPWDGGTATWDGGTSHWPE